MHPPFLMQSLMYRRHLFFRPGETPPILLVTDGLLQVTRSPFRMHKNAQKRLVAPFVQISAFI